jgi:predicted DCC family thiol-disulfide oxidoreductase YuxK
MTLVFYDGVCALCNGVVTFLLKRDRAATFRFAPLQSEIARQLLTPEGIDPAALDSLVVVSGWQTSHQRILVRSAGVLHAMSQLGGMWRVLAGAARILPRPVADVIYSAVARVRYTVFGKLDVCRVPPPEWRNRFLE